jgi:hypothetical protein
MQTWTSSDFLILTFVFSESTKQAQTQRGYWLGNISPGSRRSKEKTCEVKCRSKRLWFSHDVQGSNFAVIIQYFWRNAGISNSWQILVFQISWTSCPDATTIWLFSEILTKAGKIKELFCLFDKFFNENGYAARKGQIVDASIDNTLRLWDVRPYTLFLHGSKPKPLYFTFIEAVKFFWQLDVQGA